MLLLFLLLHPSSLVMLMMLLLFLLLHPSSLMMLMMLLLFLLLHPSSLMMLMMLLLFLLLHPSSPLMMLMMLLLFLLLHPSSLVMLMMLLCESYERYVLFICSHQISCLPSLYPPPTLTPTYLGPVRYSFNSGWMSSILTSSSSMSSGLQYIFSVFTSYLIFFIALMIGDTSPSSGHSF